MNFEHILLRLKQQLGVTTDREVAAALGLSKTAFSERKRRGVFPIEDLAVLTGSNRNLNYDYIVTGNAACLIADDLNSARAQVEGYKKREDARGLYIAERTSNYEVGLSERASSVATEFESLNEVGKLAVEAMLAALRNPK